MAIITLTSDLGLRDHYVALVKAAILAQSPQAVIIDISHDVRSFDIGAAAFLLRSSWQHFPMGTVHVIGINPELTATQAHVVVQYMGHYFISADNGIFSLLFDEEPDEIYEINLNQGADWTFPMKGVFATAAAHLSKGGAPDFLGKRIESIQIAFMPGISIEEKLLRGRVEYIDHYGNVYTNITRSVFESVRKKRLFAVQFKSSGFAIKKISHYFTDALVGERLAMWASNDALMIAIHGGAKDNGGGASSLFGLEVDDVVRIEFYGDENSEDDLSE
ncbi:MAG: SAM-dependent chlorinase/fluorinase [Flavobacteriales bacterium]|nr:SAM-dependent chlorinase/fluorinase [Flavobacteriales bacterium]